MAEIRRKNGGRLCRTRSDSFVESGERSVCPSTDWKKDMAGEKDTVGSEDLAGKRYGLKKDMAGKVKNDMAGKKIRPAGAAPARAATHHTPLLTPHSSKHRYCRYYCKLQATPPTSMISKAKVKKSQQRHVGHALRRILILGARCCSISLWPVACGLPSGVDDDGSGSGIRYQQQPSLCLYLGV